MCPKHAICCAEWYDLKANQPCFLSLFYSLITSVILAGLVHFYCWCLCFPLACSAVFSSCSHMPYSTMASHLRGALVSSIRRGSTR